MQHTATIDWEKFKQWKENPEISDKYSTLLEGYKGWEDDEQLPWDEIAKAIENSTIEGNEFDWFMENIDRINAA